MESPLVGKVIFCSISRKEKILYSFNGGDSSVESLARLCLTSAPPFHSTYFHTSGDRSYSFLFHSDLTYFAITTRSDHPHDPKIKILRFLHQIRSGFDSGGTEDLVAVIKRLIDSTEESMGRMDSNNNNNGSGLTSSSSSTKAPLLDRREEEELSLEISDDAAEEEAMRKRRRLARETWRRYVKIVVAVDFVVCAVLFAIWMAVCRGFSCLS